MFSYDILIADDRRQVANSLRWLISGYLNRSLGMKGSIYNVKIETDKNVLATNPVGIVKQFDMVIVDMAWGPADDISGLTILPPIKNESRVINKPVWTILYTGTDKDTVAHIVKEQLSQGSPEQLGIDRVITKFDRNDVSIDEIKSDLKNHFHTIRKSYFLSVNVKQALDKIRELDYFISSIRGGNTIAVDVDDVARISLAFHPKGTSESVDLEILFPEEIKTLKDSKISDERKAACLEKLSDKITDLISVRNKFQLLRKVFVDDHFVYYSTHIPEKEEDKKGNWYLREDFVSGRVKNDFDDFKQRFESEIEPFLIVNEYLASQREDEISIIRNFIDDVESLFTEGNDIEGDIHGKRMCKLRRLGRSLRDQFRFEMRKYFEPLGHPDFTKLPTQAYCYKVAEGLDAIMQLSEPAVKRMMIEQIECVEPIEDRKEYYVSIVGEGKGLEVDLIEIFTKNLTGEAGATLVKIPRHLSTYFEVIVENKTTTRYQRVKLSTLPKPKDITTEVDQSSRLQTNGVRFSLRFSLVEPQRIVEGAKGGQL